MASTPIRIELPTTFGMKTVNCYLFAEPEPILVDCGENTDESWEALKKGLQDNGFELADIKKVYISHLHYDHFGAAGRLATEFGTEIWLNKMSDGKAQNFDTKTAATNKKIYGLITKYALYNPENAPNPFMTEAGSPKANISKWHPMPEDSCNVYNIGDQLNFGNQMWEVIYMPGHASTQVVYYQKESKQLLSTDMLLAVTPTPFFEFDDSEDSAKRIKGLPIMMESYKRLLELDMEIAHPGHYEVITNPREVVEKQINHIHKRKEVCYEFIKAGTKGYLKLYEQMYDRFTIAAATMLVGYVDLLEQEGRVKWKESEFTARVQLLD